MNSNSLLLQIKNRSQYLYFIIPLVLILFYSQILNSGFIYIGDYHVSNVKSSNILTAFTVNGQVEPLTYLSFYLNFLIDPLNTFQLHLTNIALHIINTVLCYNLFSLLPIIGEVRKERQSEINKIALWGALFFCLLPVNSNSIAWIYSRNQLLLCSFVLSSLITYLKFRKSNDIKYYIYSCLFLTLGCICCRNCYYVFTFYFLVGLVQKERFNKRSILQLFILAVICLISFTVYEKNHFYNNPDYNYLTLAQKFVKGITDILLPLNVDFYTPVSPISGSLAGIALTLIFAVPLLSFFLFRGTKLLFFNIAWLTFLSLIIMAHFFADKTLEHNFNSLYYLITIIPCYLFIVAISVVFEHWKNNKAIVPIFYCGIMFYYMLIGSRTFSPFESDLKLWDYTLEKHPKDTSALNLRLRSIIEHKSAIFSEFTAIPKVHFSSTDNDLGVIQRNTPVHTVFQFVNKGTEPIIVKRIVTSCGCTTSEWTYTPILPDRSGKIDVTFDPRGQSGIVNKSVEVYINQSSQYITLKFSALIN
jgi:hypothetical protein